MCCQEGPDWKFLAASLLPARQHGHCIEVQISGLPSDERIIGCLSIGPGRQFTGTRSLRSTVSAQNPGLSLGWREAEYRPAPFSQLPAGGGGAQGGHSSCLLPKRTASPVPPPRPRQSRQKASWDSARLAAASHGTAHGPHTRHGPTGSDSVPLDSAPRFPRFISELPGPHLPAWDTVGTWNSMELNDEDDDSWRAQVLGPNGKEPSKAGFQFFCETKLHITRLEFTEQLGAFMALTRVLSTGDPPEPGTIATPSLATQTRLDLLHVCMIQEHTARPLITDLIMFLWQHTKISLCLPYPTQGLASPPETLGALQEVQRASPSTPRPPNTPRLLLPANRLHLPTNSQLACLLMTQGTGLNETQHLFPITDSAPTYSINGNLGGRTTE